MNPTVPIAAFEDTFELLEQWESKVDLVKLHNHKFAIIPRQHSTTQDTFQWHHVQSVFLETHVRVAPFFLVSNREQLDPILDHLVACFLEHAKVTVTKDQIQVCPFQTFQLISLRDQKFAFHTVHNLYLFTIMCNEGKQAWFNVNFYHANTYPSGIFIPCTHSFHPIVPDTFSCPSIVLATAGPITMWKQRRTTVTYKRMDLSIYESEKLKAMASKVIVHLSNETNPVIHLISPVFGVHPCENQLPMAIDIHYGVNQTIRIFSNGHWCKVISYPVSIKHMVQDEPNDDLKQLLFHVWNVTHGLMELQTHYALVQVDGSLRIVDFELEHQTYVHKFIEPNKFKPLRVHKIVYKKVVNKEGNSSVLVEKNLVDVWIASPLTVRYKGVSFEPNAKQFNSQMFNLWTGLAVQPVQNLEKVKPIVDHIYHVICNGKLDAFLYLIQWLAHCVQVIDKKPGVAVCITGSQGSGKSTLANLMNAIFGVHGMHITNSTTLVNEFNSFLAKIVFLNVDEAYWAGNKQHESSLKGLVTETNIAFNEKYGPILQLPNYTRLMFTTNSKWIVPVDKDNRRYFCLTASDKMIGNRAYFDRLHAVIEHGGKEAFLHFLLSLDISSFRVQDFPETNENLNQRIESDPFLEWWIECIKTKSLVGISDNESATFCQANNRYYVARDSLTYAINQFYPNTIKRQCNLSDKFKTVLPCVERVSKRDRQGNPIVNKQVLIILDDRFPTSRKRCISISDNWKALKAGFSKFFNLELLKTKNDAENPIDYWSQLKFRRENEANSQFIELASVAEFNEDEWLQNKGFKRVHCPYSTIGNCQFDTIAFQMENKYSAAELRKLAVQWLRDHGDFIAPNQYCNLQVLANVSSLEEWNTWCDRMAQDGTFGEDVTLIALAQVLQVNIRVYSRVNNQLTPTVYSYSEQAKTIDIFCQLKEQHFICIEPVPSSVASNLQESSVVPVNLTAPMYNVEEDDDENTMPEDTMPEEIEIEPSGSEYAMLEEDEEEEF